MQSRSSFLSYLAECYTAWWIYAILAIAITQAFLVVFGPVGIVAGSFRIVLGLGVLGFLPGYSSQRALFPGKDLPILEQLLLSIFLSIIISVSIGISLGFVFLFRPELNVALLSLYIFVVTLVAGYRSFHAERKRQ